MAFPWAALISAGAQIGGGLLDNYMSKQAEERAYERQKDLMALNNDYNLKFYEMNNKYNTPSEQLQRLLSAGLTSSGAVSTLASNSAQTPNSNISGAPVSHKSNIGDIISNAGANAIDSLKTKAEIKNLNADTETKEQTRPFELNKLQSEIDKFSSEIGLNNSQKEQLDHLNKYIDQKSEAEINLIIEQKKKVEEEISKLKQEKNNLKQDEIKSIWENFYRNNFGIDPNSNIMNMLVTSSLDGKIEPIWNAFEKTVNYAFNKFVDYGNQINDNFGLPNITWREAMFPTLSAMGRGYNWLYDKISPLTNSLDNIMSNYAKKAINVLPDIRFNKSTGSLGVYAKPKSKSKGHSFKW